MPKFRLPAALVSPASLFLVGGIVYYFSLDKPSEDELNTNIGREFPDVRMDGWVMSGWIGVGGGKAERSESGRSRACFVRVRPVLVWSLLCACLVWHESL